MKPKFTSDDDHPSASCAGPEITPNPYRTSPYDPIVNTPSSTAGRQSRHHRKPAPAPSISRA